MKREYIRPGIIVVALDGSCLLGDLASGNFIEKETEEISIFTDGEKVKPEAALGKKHHSLWDDWEE